jgi:hypothetical protein
MNELHNGFYDQVRNQYPQLKEQEFRICCLSCEGFDDTEISILLNINKSSMLPKWRTAIRQKIGIPSYGDFNDFFHLHLPEKVD